MNKFMRCIASLLIVLFLSYPACTFASTGDGSGDGNSKGLGENKDIALTLEHCSIKNNAKNVALNETIQLDFNKNICNITVVSNNKMCFHLIDELGNAVPLNLIFPDDQVQQDYKRQVFITPLSDLEPETLYYIVVDNTLMAKNGTYIDKGYVIEFTSGTERTNNENALLTKLGICTTTYQMTDSTPINVSDLEDISQATDTNTNVVAIIAAVCLSAILLIFSASFILIKRKK